MNNAVIAGTIASEPVLQYTQDGQTAIAVTTLQIPGLRGDDPAETLKAVVWGNTGQEFGVRKFPVGTEMVFEGRLSMDLVERDGYKEKVAKLNVSRFYPIASATVPQATTAAPIAPPPTPPATAEPAKATAKASKAKAEAAKADAPVDEYDLAEIPF
ncbi:MAG: single-stranded DNA-binding protein [Microcoleus sp.]